MLYSIYPIDAVFPEDMKYNVKCIKCGNDLVMARDEGNGTGCIERIYSSDASCYLKQNMMPGTLIKMF